jgi:tubulin--tyrosine ligase
MKNKLPCRQKSWIGKAYQIKDTINMSHYYPPPGKLDKPWTLLDGTPATCSNIALHNLYPGEVSLVVSGPNYGRNTTSAFAMSSGTVGAAMSASMAGVPAIALSYGIFDKPIPEGVLHKANEIACTVIQKLCRSRRSLQPSSGLFYYYSLTLLSSKGITCYQNPVKASPTSTMSIFP